MIVGALPLLALLLWVTTPPMPEDGPCVCAAARVDGGWCGAHDLVAVISHWGDS